MSPTILAATLLILASVAYVLGRGRAVALAGGRIASLHSVPQYYGGDFLVGYRPARFVLPAKIPPYYDVHGWAMSTWWASPQNR